MSNVKIEKPAEAMEANRQVANAGKAQPVEFDKIVTPDNNVRSPATLQVEAMVSSVKRHGYKKNHPLVVVKKGNEYHVLCGFRRTFALRAIREESEELFKELLPTGKVPCIVHTKLTELQETLIRNDHGSDENRVALDDWGYFLSIRQLMQAGIHTQAGIAEKLGKMKKDKKTGNMVPNRSWVQPRAALAQLPRFVQEQYRILWTDPDGKSKTAVRTPMIMGLFKVYNDANLDEKNPEFVKLWKECLTPITSNEAKPLSAKVCKEKAAMAQSATVKNALLVAGGHSEEEIAEIDKACAQAESGAAQLTRIAEYLGETKFAKLCSDANAKASQPAS